MINSISIKTKRRRLRSVIPGGKRRIGEHARAQNKAHGTHVPSIDAQSLRRDAHSG